jgi:hypothetical protein
MTSPTPSRRAGAGVGSASSAAAALVASSFSPGTPRTLTDHVIASLTSPASGAGAIARAVPLSPHASPLRFVSFLRAHEASVRRLFDALCDERAVEALIVSLPSASGATAAPHPAGATTALGASAMLGSGSLASALAAGTTDEGLAAAAAASVGGSSRIPRPTDVHVAAFLAGLTRVGLEEGWHASAVPTP